MDGQPWHLVGALRNEKETPPKPWAALKPWLNAVAFGDKETGGVPPDGAAIDVTYRYRATPRSVVTDHFTSTGVPWQIHRLSRPLLELDLQPPDDLEPRLTVQTDGQSEVDWRCVTDSLDMNVGARQYTFEPFHNALRFGDKKSYGALPLESARLWLSGRITRGAADTLPPRDVQFTFLTEPGVKLGLDPSFAEAERYEIRAGSNPTTLDDARQKVLALLRLGLARSHPPGF